MRKTVGELLDKKGRKVWSATPDTPVYEALQLMAEKNIGALVVLDGDELRGIFSERDYARKVDLAGRDSRGTPLREIMTELVATVRPDQSVEECMSLMTDKRVRHLPVLQDEALVGLISIGDIVKAVIDDQQFMIRQLEKYITGSH